jgi:hypothetical protein
MSETIEQAAWTAEGEPANLAAAAADALQWLDLFSRCEVRNRVLKLDRENRKRLTGCMSVLKEQLRCYLTADPFDETNASEEVSSDEQEC